MRGIVKGDGGICSGKDQYYVKLLVYYKVNVLLAA